MKHCALLIALIILAAVPVGVAEPSVPQTIAEAFVVLDQRLTDAQRREFAGKAESEATVEAHMGLGMYIRNEWFRSGKSGLVGKLHDLGGRSLDDLSSMVLTSYWRHLNGKKLELEAQGECYRRWWQEQDRLKREAEEQGLKEYGSPIFDCP